MALSILLLVLSIFLTNYSIAKERNPTMDILLIPVGEVDRKVIEVLQNELSRSFITYLGIRTFFIRGG